MAPNCTTDLFKPNNYKRIVTITKSRLETLKKIVDELQDRPETISQAQKRSLKMYNKEIDRLHEEFTQIFTRATCYDEEDAIPDVELAEDQNAINDNYVYVSSTIEDLLDARYEVEGLNYSSDIPNVTGQPAAQSLNGISDSNSAIPCVARLPKLELIKFNGEYANWTTFINLFNTTIHVNQSLSKVLKFQYLLSVLSGEPLNLIRNLSLTDANYDVAYNIIHDRYQNDRRLQLLHINRIIDLPEVSCKNFTGVREFLNSYTENFQALTAIQCNITESGHLLSALLLRKLDVELRKRLESSRDVTTKKHTLPTVEEIIEFLSNECSRHEDAVGSLGTRPKEHSFPNLHAKFLNQPGPNQRHIVASTSPNQSKLSSCAVCNTPEHKTFSCPKFLAKTPEERFQLIKSCRHCISCLGMHNIKACQSQSKCKVCHKSHNTLLHFSYSKVDISSPRAIILQEGKYKSDINDKTVMFNAKGNDPQCIKHIMVLLGTILINISTSNGITHTFRALLDSGSMCTLISERAVHLLNAKRHKCNVQLVGINQKVSHSKGQILATLQTLSGVQITTNHPMVVLDRLTVNIPRCPVSPEVIQLTQDLELADPTFHKPSRIDIILGADLFPYIFTGPHTFLGHDLPSIVGTPFGQVIMGTTPCVPSSSTISNDQINTLSLCCPSITDVDLYDSIQQFWLQEEIPSSNIQSEEDNACERLFIETHTRDDTGRYIVRLPFKDSNQSLGASRPAAELRLKAMERKFDKNERFASLYRDFMHEYIILGHMTKCDLELTTNHYFLPHHGILKETSSTTKLRTVFDASCKTSSGFSLNDLLMTGKPLQNNISDILTQFRRHSVVICCDIKQMYRQILIHPDDRNFQLILWRANIDQPIESFQLNTVTYGVNCSPYLAIRTLHQLAIDEGHDFPAASHALLHHTYVDDIITGAESIQSAIELQEQLTDLLKRGGFELRKWVSNSDKLLQQVPDAHRESPKFISESTDPHFTVLGLHWSPTSDSFCYTTHGLENASKNPTKRTVLSAISKIYDPCGFLIPFIMLAKCFMQLIWTLGLAWDARLPSDVQDQWERIVDETHSLSQISIPRTLNLDSSCKIELHGFCDASEKGYAAVIYFRSERSDKFVTTNFVAAKSRVAPLKRVTIPRLELCAAYILSRLVAHYVKLFPDLFNTSNIFLWSDSTVALTWIHTPPYRLKTYVANRVAQIQELVSSECWFHISSQDNPADCASRGLCLSQLIKHNLLWNGPQWLLFPSCEWPSNDFTPIPLNNQTELKATPLPVFTTSSLEEWSILTKYSSWSKLLRITALVLRFINNCKGMTYKYGHITSSEIKTASMKIFFIVQQVTFLKEYNDIKQGKCPNSLCKLSPFIDDQQLIRVGGRLSRSSLTYEAKHPVLLPKRHHIVDLIIDYFHLQYLHAGPQLVHSMIIRQVWIINARNVIRLRIHKCIICFRHRPTNSAPFMADLPPVRTEPAKPFASTGIDYCGPFSIKVTNLRFIKHIKVYICIFICMVTKAVHIEVVTDLTTDAFIAALTRFVSRRGICTEIYSDCGTNFIGAHSTLRKIVQTTVTNAESQLKIRQCSSTLSLQFHFNPPAAPHHGGLWERAVRSVKHHLSRVIGKTILTLQEFTTLTTRIEAILNSRPLTPMSSDPHDLSVLTPGHFITGAPLIALPESNVIKVPQNRLKHWHLVQQFAQQIWKRWSAEYLHTLQQRIKWNTKTPNMQVGDLVLLKTTEATLFWPLARIIEVYPGSDDTVRVVKIKTQDGIYVRPVTQLFPLPQEQRG